MIVQAVEIRAIDEMQTGPLSNVAFVYILYICMNDEAAVDT